MLTPLQVGLALMLMGAIALLISVLMAAGVGREIPRNRRKGR